MCNVWTFETFSQPFTEMNAHVINNEILSKVKYSLSKFAMETSPKFTVCDV